MKIFKHIALAAAALVAFASCSNDLAGTDWAPGEPSSAPGIYFSPDNESFIALIDGGTTAHLKVMRMDNKGALDVEVLVNKADENMVIPSSISFADGSYETTLDIDCARCPDSVNVPFEITFPEKFINPYAAGAAVFAGSVIVSSWENVDPSGLTAFEVRTWNYEDAGFLPIESAMYHLKGSDRYRVVNFLNTGIDFNFELVPSKLQEGYYRIMPLDNQLTLSDYGWGDVSYYNSWWLVTQDEEGEYEWPEFEFMRADGSSMIVYFLQFLWYDEATKKEYCYALNRDKGTPVVYMTFFGNLDEDMETYSSYYRLRFAWTEQPAQAE